MGGVNHMRLGKFPPVQMPDHMNLKLQYDQFVSITSIGAEGQEVWSLNSCYDPYTSGTGGQPGGFSVWDTLYGNYRVLATEVQLEAVDQTATNSALVVLAPTNQANPSQTAQQAARGRHAVAALATQQKPPRIYAKYHLSDLFGITDQAILDVPQYQAAIGSSPGAQYYFAINTHTAGATDTVVVWVRITYYVRMEAPIYTFSSPMPFSMFEQRLEELRRIDQSKKDIMRLRVAARSSSTSGELTSCQLNPHLVGGSEPQDALAAPLALQPAESASEKIARLERLVSALLIKSP